MLKSLAIVTTRFILFFGLPKSNAASAIKMNLFLIARSKEE